MKKILATTLIVLSIVVACVVAAHAFDLVGMLRRMHGH
jgi:hypothetical protein